MNRITSNGVLTDFHESRYKKFFGKNLVQIHSVEPESIVLGRIDFWPIFIKGDTKRF